jgi:hypothetical protein
MSPTSVPVILTEAERVRLEQWIRAGSSPQQVVMRARVILAASAGASDKTIAASRRWMLNLSDDRSKKAKELFLAAWDAPSGSVTTHAEWVTRSPVPDLRREAIAGSPDLSCCHNVARNAEFEFTSLHLCRCSCASEKINPQRALSEQVIPALRACDGARDARTAAGTASPPG